MGKSTHARARHRKTHSANDLGFVFIQRFNVLIDQIPLDGSKREHDRDYEE